MANTIPVHPQSRLRTPLPPVSPDTDPFATGAASVVESRAPRYTSFPTADRFVDAFSSADLVRHLGVRADTPARPWSVYLHIPFCESLCYFCGCNKKVTRDHRKAAPYLKRLMREVELVGRYIGSDRRVSQVHWGGGTPTFLSDDEIRELLRHLHDHFYLEADGEYSIEVDPRSTSVDTIQMLGDEGFNRLSLGVQDFCPDVQRAVNRIQSAELVHEMSVAARASGFKSVNFDLIYGLPLQTEQTFSDTVDRVVGMRPDRIAMYHYAHLPSRFAAQRRILEAELPTQPERTAIFNRAAEQFRQAGYVYIGMDHFALPDDDLAVALKRGELHRNFQGYTTQPDCDLLGFGASAISRVGACYSQNIRTVRHYCDTLDRGELPVCRGIELSRDDLLRREVISSLMCQGRIEVPVLSATYELDFERYFRRELTGLQDYADSGLVRMTDDLIEVTADGRRHALRSICSEFDPYFQSSIQRNGYSRVL